METFGQLGRYIVFLLLFRTMECQRAGRRPTCEMGGLKYSAVDLNLTISWDPCNVPLLGNETILYTVIRSLPNNQVLVVPHCVNISSMNCYLAPMFPTGDEFRWNEYFLVKFISSLRPTLSGESRLKQFANWNVEVSAPVIFDSSVTSSNVTVWVHGPVTPYIKNNRTRRMGERGLAKRLHLEKIFYQSKLINVDDPDETPKTIRWNPSDSGEERVVYSHLFPYTRYSIQVQCRLGSGGSASGGGTNMEFRTGQHAPEFGPRIANHTLIRRSCDHRDVLIFWEESSHQRSNVEITSYTLTWNDKVSHEVKNVTVPVNNQSAVASNVIRWHEYAITVSSRNSEGAKEGETYIIKQDERKEESYKSTNMTFAPISSTQWNLTWNPPTEHQQCIRGYHIVTHIDGAQEEDITVEGYDTTWALLHFMKVGRYVIDLSTMVNDISQTRFTITKEYHVEVWKFRQWSILAAIMLLLIFAIIAVIIMFRKVCCDLSRLPDISKSRSMRLASANEPFISTMKTPPEPEVFHATNKCMPVIDSTPERGCSVSDDVSAPHPTSTDALSPLHGKSSDCLGHNGTTSTDALSPLHGKSSDCLGHHGIKMHEATTTPAGEEGSRDSIIAVNDRGSSSVVGPPGMEPSQSEYKRPKSGYVRSAPKTKPSLTVYIPKHISSMNSGPDPHSSSVDSGICTSPYSGPCSDYIPASPAIGSGTRDTWYGYDFQSELPYVASSAAGRTGKTQSTSSEPDQEPMSYRKIDPKYLKGYLPMSPCSPNSPAPTSPTMDPYSKTCAKLEPRLN